MILLLQDQILFATSIIGGHVGADQVLLPNGIALKTCSIISCFLLNHG
jgi:hypothetical protein